MLYFNNFSPSSCVIYVDLSFFSFPLLNFFLVINFFMFPLPASISQAMCEQRMFVCTCMFSFHFISFVTFMKINKLQIVPHPSNSSANSASPLPPTSSPPLPSLPFPSPPFSIPIMLTASELLTMAVMLE